jgi:cephalosporin-C deacetylase-like acetyl esterase
MKIFQLIGALLFMTAVSAQIPDSLALVFRYERLPKMSFATDSSASSEGVAIQKIKYSGKDRFVVSALLTYPEKTRTSYPLIVFGHWGEGDKSEFLAEATALSQKGFVCILPDGPWLCPDSPITSFKRQGFEMYRQYVMNARTAIDLAYDNFAIDGTRIFYTGHSFGCNAAAVLSAIDKRIDYFVFMAGAYSTVDNIENSRYPDFVAWREKEPDAFKDWKKRLKKLDAKYYLPYKSVPCLIQQADQDEFISNAENNAFASGTPEPKEVLRYPTNHSLSGQPQTDRQRWILSKLPK